MVSQRTDAYGRLKSRRRGLDHFRWLRWALKGIYRFVYVRLLGMKIDPTVEFSLSAKFDRTFPIGVVIGEYSYVAFEARILCHDYTRGLSRQTVVGRNCFIGGRSILMPGIEVGDNSIVAAGSVVTKSVPPRSIVAGNPARLIRSDIEVGRYGRFLTADETESALVAQGLD